jgi:hypothetical protein
MNPKRTIEIIDVIDAGIIEKAQQLEKMTRTSTEAVTILINSPGGYIDPGFVFVDAVEQAKARGVKVKCATGVLSASMAFIILSHCSERYALPNTMLLFHPVSFGGDSIRITEVIPSLLETERREARVSRDLMEAMGLSWKQYHPHLYSETLWSGTGLADYTKSARFITVVDSIDGTDKQFVYRESRGLFFNKSSIIQRLPAPIRHLYR